MRSGLSLLIGLVFVCCGCTVFSQAPPRPNEAGNLDRMMASWVGHHEAELVAKWGRPTRTKPDGQGGKIIIYEFKKGIWADDEDKKRPTSRNPGYIAVRIFYVNDEHIIRGWKWSGL